MSFGTLFALLCLALAAWCLRDAVRLLLFRRPTPGRVVASSYGEAERLIARDAHPWDWLYKVTAGNKKPVVKDVLTIEYEVDGRRHHAAVETAHMRGDRADRNPTVWYDPHDPDRMTINGPGGDLFTTIVLFGLAAWAAGLLPGR